MVIRAAQNLGALTQKGKRVGRELFVTRQQRVHERCLGTLHIGAGPADEVSSATEGRPTPASGVEVVLHAEEPPARTAAKEVDVD